MLNELKEKLDRELPRTIAYEWDLWGTNIREMSPGTYLLTADYRLKRGKREETNNLDAYLNDTLIPTVKEPILKRLRKICKAHGCQIDEGTAEVFLGYYENPSDNPVRYNIVSFEFQVYVRL